MRSHSLATNLSSQGYHQRALTSANGGLTMACQRVLLSGYLLVAHNRLRPKLGTRSHLAVPIQTGLKLKSPGRLPNRQLYQHGREPLKQVLRQTIHNLDFEALGLEHLTSTNPRQQDLHEILMDLPTS